MRDPRDTPLRVLLEPPRRRWLSLEAVLSLLVHAALVGAIALYYVDRPERPAFTEQFVTYLVPPDRTLPREATASETRYSEPAEEGAEGDAPAATTEGAGRRAAGQADTTRPSASTGEAPGVDGATVLSELEVDSTVRRFPESAAPAYPPHLLERNVEGSALVSFVVDTTGRVDTLSFRVLRATHPEFAEAVRAALPGMRFRPAILQGNRVRQLVQQSFRFRIQRPDTVPPRPTRPPEG